MGLYPMDGSEEEKTPDDKTTDNPSQDKKKEDGDFITMTKDELQKQLNEMAGKTRSEERTKFERKLQTEKEAAALEEAQKNNDWKTIAEGLQKKLDENNPIVERYNKLTPIVLTDIELRLKTFPAEILELKPETDDLVEISNWVKKVTPLVAKFSEKKAPDFQHEKSGEKGKEKNNIPKLLGNDVGSIRETLKNN